MIPRRLAGSRRNKHLPIARRTLHNDRQEMATPAHRHSTYWKGDLGECGGSCACGVTYDGFDRLREVARFVDRHIVRARFGGKPDHAARAVDIHAIWPSLELDRTKAVRQVAAEAGARGKSAEPMDFDRRHNAYVGQSGCRRPLTDRQVRQLARKDSDIRARLRATA